uniref:Uncharacterized protein n=1 Tax=Lactuca sativa TaxID=4236 RepID=A0A9R1VFM7_LACSA|nr:hypothetical protein LSAT_V11C500290340 [Lactuca sativa]
MIETKYQQLSQNYPLLPHLIGSLVLESRHMRYQTGSDLLDMNLRPSLSLIFRIPVGANMNLKKNWKPFIDRFQAKLSKWKSKTLLFGCRLTLVQSVLGSLLTYYRSLFMSPGGVFETLEKDSKKVHLWWFGKKEDNPLDLMGQVPHFQGYRTDTKSIAANVRS